MCIIIVVVKNYEKRNIFSHDCVLCVVVRIIHNKGTQLNIHQIPHFFNCGEPPNVSTTMSFEPIQLNEKKDKKTGVVIVVLLCEVNGFM